ncbi:MAG: YkvA family protein [Eubacteriales bacterium]|nr:YkvA family protein [Eubacteriales bacterium]
MTRSKERHPFSGFRARLKRKADELKAYVATVFLCLKSRDTPWFAKVLAGITVAYALSPIDLIPDFIPVLGFLDDVLLLPMLIALTMRLIPGEVWARCREEARSIWADGWPKKWRYALPTAAVWLLVLAVIARIIFFR